MKKLDEEMDLLEEQCRLLDSATNEVELLQDVFQDMDTRSFSDSDCENDEADEIELLQMASREESEVCILEEAFADLVELSEQAAEVVTPRSPIMIANEDGHSKPYEVAVRLMASYKFAFLDKPTSLTPVSFYNGRYWSPLTASDVEQLAYEVMTYAEKKQIANLKQFLKSVYDFLRAETLEDYKFGNSFSDEDFKKVQNRIVFRNCVFDAVTQEMLAFDSSLPYSFGVNANYISGKCKTPIYNKLKKDATCDDQESMDMFDYWMGYLMVPNRSAKIFGVAAYAKDSGKTIWGNLCESIYEGNRVNTIDISKLAERFEYANAPTTLLYTNFDLNTDSLTTREVAEIKKLTGEKQMRIEVKYGDLGTVAIHCKLMFASNSGITIKNASSIDDAFYRRVVVFPFIKSQDRDNLMNNMQDILFEERDAILSKCARKLRNIIADDGGIVFPESQLSRRIKRSWISYSDHFQDFLDETLTVTENEADFVATCDLYEIYKRFCNENSIPMSDRRGERSVTPEILKRFSGRVAEAHIMAASLTDPRVKSRRGICYVRVKGRSV